MSDKQEPTQPEGAATEQAPPAWEVRNGRVFIDGTDVTEIVNPAFDENSEQPPKAETDNAALEGEEAEPEEPEKAEEPEPEKVEPEKPAEETPEEPEVPEEPAKWDFKLKFRNNVEEVAFTQEEVQQRLAKLRAFEENQKEFWDQRREVEPYWNIVKSDWFKERLKEAYESGELKEPPRPPEPPAAVQYEVLKRQADPDYDRVLLELQNFAMTLPTDAMKLIDSDPNVFLSEYDRIAKEVRERKADKPATESDRKPPKKSPEDVKRELERKESAKSRASVNKPGTAPPPPPSPVKAWEQEKRRLERAMRDPNNSHINLELTAKLLEHLDKRPQ